MTSKVFVNVKWMLMSSGAFWKLASKGRQEISVSLGAGSSVAHGLASRKHPRPVLIRVRDETGTRVCSVLCLLSVTRSGNVEDLGDSGEERRSLMEKALRGSRQLCLVAVGSVLACKYMSWPGLSVPYRQLICVLSLPEFCFCV